MYEIPEVCGPIASCRSTSPVWELEPKDEQNHACYSLGPHDGTDRLWLPKHKWRGAMRAIRAELERPLVPEHSPQLATASLVGNARFSGEQAAAAVS